MANTYSCNFNTLLTLAKCFSDKCTGRVDRNALIIYARTKNLAALGGTDYSSNLKQLMIDAGNWRNSSRDELHAVEVYEAIQNATNNGASLSSDANSLAASAKCFSSQCLGEADQLGVLGFLKCTIETQDKPS